MPSAKIIRQMIQILPMKDVRNLVSVAHCATDPDFTLGKAQHASVTDLTSLLSIETSTIKYKGGTRITYRDGIHIRCLQWLDRIIVFV